MPKTRHLPSRTALALLWLLALSSCGDDGTGADSEASASSTTETSAGTTTTTRPTTTTAPVPPEPADGADVAACFDGSCDVEVALPVEVPLDPALLVGSMTLRPLGPDMLAIDAVGLMGGSASTGQTGVGGTYGINNVHIRVVALEGQTARVILTPCAEIEGCEPVTPRP